VWLQSANHSSNKTAASLPFQGIANLFPTIVEIIFTSVLSRRALTSLGKGDGWPRFQSLAAGLCRRSVQRPHDPDPGEHRRAAKLGNEKQGFHCGLPFRGIVLGFRKFGDLERGVP
jgi:hypothetical protein